MEYEQAVSHWGAKALEAPGRDIDEATVSVDYHDDGFYGSTLTGATHELGVEVTGRDKDGRTYSVFVDREFLDVVSEIVEICKR